MLYAAGSSSVGAGATNLLDPNVVMTDSSGDFTITGDYSCPSPTTQVYIVARGGNPGLASGADNPALVLAALLGDCGTLTSSTHIVINELTTGAAAWCAAQFFGSNAAIGTSPTNAAGLRNAFSIAQNLVDATTGFSPEPAPPGTITESKKLFTLANALSACTNSDGGASCDPLFNAASSASLTPQNTLDAALNIVRNPASHVADVFNAVPSQAPFEPSLQNPPNDWTMSLTYAGGGLSLPGGLAIDMNGNVWVANYFGGVVSEFSTSGAPTQPNGFPGAGLSQSYGIAVDANGNIWVTNEQSVTAANNHHLGSVSEFLPSGEEASGNGYTGGGLYYPLAVAADQDGSIWIADYGSSAATLLGPTGVAISPSSGDAASSIPFPSAVAIDASHNAWFAVEGGVARVTPSGLVSNFNCCSDPAGIVVDASNNIWVADYSASAIVKLSPNGVVQSRTILNAGNGGPQGIAVDGAANVWAANYYGNSLVDLSGSTAALLSSPLGYGLDAPLSEPYGLAIDASGNIWVTNSGSNTITQFVGLATPVKTPQLGPAVKP
jgi:streptogramin lyase